MSQEFKVGQIIENSLRQFTKIISVRNGIYGISGWASRESAEKATVAHKFVNKYGLAYANAVIVKGSKASVSKPTETDESSEPATDKLSKSAINKLNAADAKALAEKEGLSIEGNAKDVKERLCAHFGL
jgi:hypothetical protein